MVEKIKLLFWLCVTQSLLRLVYERIGRNTIVRAPLCLNGRGVILGSNVRIAPLTRLETFSEYSGHQYNPHLSIGDNTSIEQSCHISAVRSLCIGHDTVISSFVLIQDHEHSMDDACREAHILERPLVVKDVNIGNKVFIGSGAKILAGSTIGDRCVVGANAVVKGKFPEDCVIAGVPARIIRNTVVS
jgi:acetyltransferase-like isoleucine patch superfamily enzyme